VSVQIVSPWETPEWNDYVSSHPGATMYHTADWCRIVSEIGRYRPACLMSRDGGRVSGVLPVVEIRSRLTGNRMTALPFSDECSLLCDDEAAAHELLAGAAALRDERGLGFFEMRGEPSLRGGSGVGVLEAEGYSRTTHFVHHRIPLSDDTEAVFRTFKKKSVRQVINKGFRLGVTVRRGEGEADLREFYRLYVLNRRGHGIPPQPLRLFSLLFERLRDEPSTALYLAHHEGTAVASLITVRYRGVTVGKYEGIDHAYRHVMPVYPLLWKSIEESALLGDRYYDMGRTAMDNPGLDSFKNHWGTERSELPYFLYPAGDAVSVVKNNSLKYRLFTGVFRRLPPGLTVALGSRFFRHFG
jgi:CelD/BcsL family acetyltransferase involved in cellulose biosynthesis